MVLFTQISTSSTSYPFVEDLYVSAFPPEERRPIVFQRANIDDNPLMRLLLISDEQKAPIGFITYWTFDSFCYVEHFAIHPIYRNKGFGSQSILSFINSVQLPVVLECELPGSSTLADRRIDFYKRSGFHLWSREYIQPPYPGNNDNGTFLSLMVTEGLEVDMDFEMIVKTIYHNVYCRTH